MKTNICHLVLSALAIICGAALLWICQDPENPIPQPADSGVEQPRVSLALEPSAFRAHPDERHRERAHQAADDAAPVPRPKSRPTGDSEAGLAVLDQLARDVASGRTAGDVFEALSVDFPASTRDAVVQIFAGQRTLSFASLYALPPPLLDALAAVLRNQADQDGLSRALDTAWREASDPSARRRLEGLEIPGLYAARVAEFTATGDTEAASIYLARLETCDHPGTPDCLAALARQHGFDLSELCDSALNWAATFPALANVPDLSARVSDLGFSPSQRIIAAAALAGAAPGAETVAALDKAARAEPSAVWRAAFESVRDLVANPVQTQP
jgi:hypothetical protein